MVVGGPLAVKRDALALKRLQGKQYIPPQVTRVVLFVHVILKDQLSYTFGLHGDQPNDLLARRLSSPGDARGNGSPLLGGVLLNELWISRMDQIGRTGA